MLAEKRSVLVNLTVGEVSQQAFFAPIRRKMATCFWYNLHYQKPTKYPEKVATMKLSRNFL